MEITFINIGAFEFTIIMLLPVAFFILIAYWLYRKKYTKK